MADRPGWQETVAAELRALGRDLDVPPPAGQTAAVRHRLEGSPRRRRLPVPGPGVLGYWRSAWRVALIGAVILLAVLIVTPPGRAVIAHVFRFVGIELHQAPGPARSPGASPSLPGERPMTLEQARRQVSFAIEVPAVLGPPDEVLVSDGGRVASLVYRRTAYGQLRMDEFAGSLDPVYFQKFVHYGKVTEVKVNGAQGLWIKGPHELVYVTRQGRPVAASARLTVGNTLIWGTWQVALRLEGRVGKSEALAIADSAG